MDKYNIMAVLINHRTQKSPKVQEVLSQHGCIIRMRVGIHETENVCSDEGLVILHLSGKQEDIKSLEGSLNALEGVKAQNIHLSLD
jgi:metal-responsive CopG/Arc/MetJ family transcriptional regulator